MEAGAISQIFKIIKESVSARQAAERYGLKVTRNGMACCPFHSDRTPSMKLDKRFHCFGCQADGDVIDFTARLYGLSLTEAARKLAQDFGIPVPEKGHFTRSRDRPQTKSKLDPQKEAGAWINHAIKTLTDYYWLLRKWEKEFAPQNMEEEWHSLFCEALDRKDYVSYLLDELMLCSKDQLLEMQNSCRTEVEKIEARLCESVSRGEKEAGAAADAGCAGG